LKSSHSTAASADIPTQEEASMTSRVSQTWRRFSLASSGVVLNSSCVSGSGIGGRGLFLLLAEDQFGDDDGGYQHQQAGHQNRHEDGEERYRG